MPKKLFTKGQSGNPKGRPKGAINRTTDQMREMVKQLVDNNLDQLFADVEKLSPMSRIIAIEKLMKYVIPTLSKNDNMNTTDGEMTISIVYATPDKTADDDTTEP